MRKYFGSHFEDQKTLQKWGARWRYRAVCHGLIIKWIPLMLDPLGHGLWQRKRANSATSTSQHNTELASVIALRGRSSGKKK